MGSLGQANVRSAYADRGAVGTPSTHAITAATGPHAETVRVSFTVPSNKIAELEQFCAEAVRVTAAAPVGLWQVVVRYTPSGGTLARIAFGTALTNAVGDKISVLQSPQSALYAGDLIELTTSDLGTGGTIAYNNGVKITQYNA